jgi:hypothetical protein
VITGNSASSGGGLYRYNSLTAYNCTITGNSASGDGGGATGGTLANCLIYFNTASTSTNVSGSSLSYCCTTPWQTGEGNITNEPSFVDWANGDLRLRYGSPCIDAGTNLTASGITTDILGTPRPLDGNWDGTNAFDIGAYEYDPQAADSNGDGIPDWWCHGYGLDPNDPTMASANPDADSFTTFEEWVAQTDPTNPASLFEILAISNFPPLQVYFPSSAGRCYTLYDSTDLVSGGWIAIPGQSNVPGAAGVNSLSDTNAPSGPRFYRVGVALP